MRDFFKKHGYDTALAVFVLVFGGSIIGLFGDVLNAFSAYPAAVSVCCGLSLVVGLGLSALADRKAVMVAKVHESAETERARLANAEIEKARVREEEKAEKEELRKAAQRDAARVASVRRMEYHDKEYLFAIYKQGTVDVSSAFRWEIEQMGFGSMVSYETVGENDRWSLLPWAKGLLERNPDVFDCVKEAMASEDDDAPLV